MYKPLIAPAGQLRLRLGTVVMAPNCHKQSRRFVQWFQGLRPNLDSLIILAGVDGCMAGIGAAREGGDSCSISQA